MTTTGKTRAELAAWLDRWNENGAAPSAETVADFLGIELAPEPTLPVGQRRRSPGGVEVIKTDDGTNSWRRYRGKACLSWFTGAEVAGWEVITDAPEVPENIIEAVILTLAADDHEQRERGFTNYRTNAEALARAGLLAGTLPEAPVCEREHLPSHSVRICLATISDDTIADLAEGAGNPSAPVADAAHRERERRRRVEGHASVTTVWSTELDLSPDAN